MRTQIPAWLLASTVLIGLGWAAEAGSQLEQPDNTIYPAITNGYQQNEKVDQEEYFPPETQRRKREFADSSFTNDVNYEADDDDGQEEIRSKRFLSLFRTRATKSEGFKRGPGFRSWGGKRSGEGKRVRFSSWGGKRELQDTKREKEYSMPFQQFQKRTKSDFSDKRQPFHTWGGKRNFFTSTLGGPVYLRQDDIRKMLSWEGKRRFSSWGGKRSDEEHEEDNEIEKRRTENDRKKQSFKSWGGKRTFEDEENLNEVTNFPETRKFT